jgi:hypothetical protein
MLSFWGSAKWSRKLKASVGVFWGRWGLPLLPRRHDIFTLVSEPISGALALLLHFVKLSLFASPFDGSSPSPRRTMSERAQSPRCSVRPRGDSRVAVQVGVLSKASNLSNGEGGGGGEWEGGWPGGRGREGAVHHMCIINFKQCYAVQYKHKTTFMLVYLCKACLGLSLPPLSLFASLPPSLFPSHSLPPSATAPTPSLSSFPLSPSLEVPGGCFLRRHVGLEVPGGFLLCGHVALECPWWFPPARACCT